MKHFVLRIHDREFTCVFEYTQRDFVRIWYSLTLCRDLPGIVLWIGIRFWQVNKIIIQKVTYSPRLMLMDRKEVSVLSASTRYFTPWSLSLLQLFAINKIVIKEFTYNTKLRSIDRKELAVLRPSLKCFIHWSVNSEELFAGK